MSNESQRDTGRDGPTRTDDSSPGSGEWTYVESQIIMTTVRIVAPFSLTYGLFLTFHGADSPGGGFQGGAIIAATVLMIAFAFGVAPTREWLRNRTVVALAAGGTAAFALVGLLPVALGDSFLAHEQFEKTFGIKPKWGLEAVEIAGVAPIVAGVLVGLFFVLAAGLFRRDETSRRLADGGSPTRRRTRLTDTGPSTDGESADSSKSGDGDRGDEAATGDSTGTWGDSPGAGDTAETPDEGSSAGGDRE
jgi:multicomponent Na+:H+ antiporter subunit B